MSRDALFATLAKLPRIPRRFRRLLRSPILVVSAASLGVRMGKDAYRMRAGEIDAKEFRARAGSHFGSISGGIAGAAAGAAAFSALPGIGTILGAFAGGMLGESVGSKIGRKGAERIEDLMSARRATASDEDSSEAPPRNGPRRKI